MPPKFGTSGLRGLVTQLTADVITSYVAAFAQACPTGTGLFVGRDLRPSSEEIASKVTRAARQSGLRVTDCGALVTPALALASMEAGAGAVMVTGSHIPADRNGLKFYTPSGEITKGEEAAIQAALGSTQSLDAMADVVHNTTARAQYVARYLDAFGRRALAGYRLGLFSHSAVGRDMLHQMLRAMGADVVELGRADDFVPVDTEAVDPAIRAQFLEWAANHQIDAIVSTDADGDRPLLTDQSGEIVVGDVLGQITGAALGAKIAVTPITSNTGAEQVFERVIRTSIGSPYVIAAIEAEVGSQVVGYEANGGFLLGFAAKGLDPLMTRDAVLPMITTLIQAKAAGGVAELVARQPARYTAADRLQGVPTDTSLRLVKLMRANADDRAAFLDLIGGFERAVDDRDGLRISLTDGRIVHLRPSGNAPELRFYVEADTSAKAQATLAQGLSAVTQMIGTLS